MTWRAGLPPLLVLALLLAAAAADLLLFGGPGSLTQARATALGVVLTAALGVVAFLLQGWQSRRSQRVAVLRAAFRSMIGATQVMIEEQAEMLAFPLGHPYLGTVSNVNPPTDYLRHDPFEQARNLTAEWQRLYVEGERELLLEMDRDDGVFVAWRTTRKSFWAWVHRLTEITQPQKADSIDSDEQLAQLDRELRSNIDAFAAICRDRIRALS